MEKQMLARGIPHIRVHTDCAGRRIEFVHGIRELEGMGFCVVASEIKGNPGYEFKSAVCATPYMAYLDVYEKIQSAMKQKYLNPTSEKVELLTNELTGKVSNDGLVVDGKAITFEQLRELVASYEGWSISIKLG